MGVTVTEPDESGARQFRWLLRGEVASVLGDQLAKVGVSLLVYERTHSAALTGLTYALTLLPDLIAGPLLSPLADRYSPRTVMTVTALVQALLAALMAIPGISVAVIGVAVAGIAAGQAPYKAAQAVLVRNVLHRGTNKAGQVKLTMIREFGQLAGLGGAAAVVGFVGPGIAVALNAVSFLLAAGAVHFGVHEWHVHRRPERIEVNSTSGLRAIRADARLRMLTWLTLIGSIAVLPEAVIVPLVRELGAPTWVMGPLLAADPLGFLIGARLVSTHCSPERQQALIGPLAVVCLAAQTVFVLHPHPVLAGLLLLISGVGASYVPLIRGEVVEVAPREITGAVIGWVRTALRAGSGAAALCGGLLAQTMGSATAAVALASTVGTVLALAVATQWHRVCNTSTRVVAA